MGATHGIYTDRAIRGLGGIMIRLFRKMKIRRFQRWLHELAVEGCFEELNCTLCPYGFDGDCMIAETLGRLDLIEKSI